MAKKATTFHSTKAPLLHAFAASECVEKGPGDEAINQRQGDFLGNVIAWAETITECLIDFLGNVITWAETITECLIDFPENVLL